MIADFYTDVVRGGVRMLSSRTTFMNKFLDGMFVTNTSTRAGVTVTEKTALTYSAVWAATWIYASTLAMTPHILYRRRPGDDGRDRAREHPLYSLLHDSPNGNMDIFSFWLQQVPYMINYGNSYSRIWRANLDPDVIIEIEPLRNENLTAVRDHETGRLAYEVRTGDGRLMETVLRRDREGRFNILHIPGLYTQDGISGVGVIQVARESIGGAQQGQQYQAGLMSNGGRPSGLLTRPAELEPLTEDGEKELLDGWTSQFGGRKSGKTAHLQEGYTFTPIYVSPADAEFIASQEFSIADMARFYNLPVHLLASRMNAPTANITAHDLGFVKRSIAPLATKVEKAETHQLLTAKEKDTLYVEILLDSLLRGDPETRSKTHRLDISHGIKTIDESRAEENKNPIGGELGRTHFIPANLQTVKKAVADEPIPAESAPPIPTEKSEEQQGALSVEPAVTAADLASLRSEMVKTLGVYRATTSEAALEVISHEVGLMLRKEALAAKRAAGKPSEFVRWIDAFYVKHIATMTQALSPAITSWFTSTGAVALNEVIGVRESIIRSHIDTSRNLLLEAAECQPGELVDRVTRCVDSWPTERRQIALPELE